MSKTTICAFSFTVALVLGDVGAGASATTLAQALPTEAATKAAAPKDIVADINDTITRRYVASELRRPLTDALSGSLRKGRYNGKSPAEVARLINQDMQRVAKDGHLSIEYNPARAQAMEAAKGRERPAPTAQETADYERRIANINHGISDLRLLPGNVRYARIDAFAWAEGKSESAYDAMMRFLGGGDAVIIDLRSNTGGDNRAVQYAMSYFLPPNELLTTFELTGQSTPQVNRTIEKLGAERISGKPIYVLTSQSTISAAEEFTAHIKGNKLGKTVGERTAGAARRNAFVPIAKQYVLSVSVGRPIIASSKFDWEGKGFAPDIESSLSRSLVVAQVAALSELASEASPGRKARLEVLGEGLKAQLQPAAIPSRATYAGKYGGVLIAAEADRLMLVQEGRTPTALSPISAGIFAPEEQPGLRVRFKMVDGVPEAVAISQADDPDPEWHQRDK